MTSLRAAERDGADDMAAAGAQQVAGAFEIGGKIGMRIEEDRLDPRARSLAANSAIAELRAVARIAPHRAVGPGGRIKNADFQRASSMRISKKQKTPRRGSHRGWGVMGRNCPATIEVM